MAEIKGSPINPRYIEEIHDKAEREIGQFLYSVFNNLGYPVYHEAVEIKNRLGKTVTDFTVQGPAAMAHFEVGKGSFDKPRKKRQQNIVEEAGEAFFPIENALNNPFVGAIVATARKFIEGSMDYEKAKKEIQKGAQGMFSLRRD